MEFKLKITTDDNLDKTGTYNYLYVTATILLIYFIQFSVITKNNNNQFIRKNK